MSLDSRPHATSSLGQPRFYYSAKSAMITVSGGSQNLRGEEGEAALSQIHIIIYGEGACRAPDAGILAAVAFNFNIWEFMARQSVHADVFISTELFSFFSFSFLGVFPRPRTADWLCFLLIYCTCYRSLTPAAPIALRRTTKCMLTAGRHCTYCVVEDLPAPK